MRKPISLRQVSVLPIVTYFKPVGVPRKYLQEVRLSVDEYEAIRLKYYKGLNQILGAEAMKVSQTTFYRILASARKKLADALSNGKAIRIVGGHFNLSYTHQKDINKETK